MIEPLHPPTVFVEFGATRLKALGEDRGLELPIERAADGKITSECSEKIIAALGKFIGRKSWQLPARALCAVGAQGVSIRKIVLPVAAQHDFERVLRLQIEMEFPLPPDELAWGWREIAAAAGKKQILVAAVRKKIVEDYSAILLAAGAKAEFTVAALARAALCPQPGLPQVVLEITSVVAEAILYDRDVPENLRVIPAGANVVETIHQMSGAKKVFVGGEPAAVDKFCAQFPAEKLNVPPGEGISSATLGLQKSFKEDRPPLALQIRKTAARSRYQFALPENKFWLKRAVWLLAILLLLPLAETVLVKPFLQWRLNVFKTQRQNFLAVVDPEMKFLLYLKQNQPPYLDAIYLFAKSAPPGCHFDSFTVNQKGDISVKAAMPNGQQVSDFRAKLIGSGFFANVTVEEQSPIQNQPRVNVRLTAQWKPAGQRAVVTVPLPDKNSTNNSSTNPPAMNLKKP